MSRYIDANDAIEAMYEQFCYAYCDNCDHDMYSDEDECEDCHRKYQRWAASKNVIEHTIEKLPTVDVVEVVRCRDCKHRPIIIEEEEIDGFSYEFPDHKCPCRCEDGLFSSNPDDDWFCANGERG